MKASCFLSLLMLLMLSGLFANTAPVISNVQASQRADGSKIVDISYSVFDADGDTLSVSLQVSNDNGASFSINPSTGNLSGAIGNGIITGANKHIIWNAGAEGISFDANQFRVKVVAEDINLTQGLVAYYPFNGNANDESGNNNHASLTGASFSADRFGNNNQATTHSFGSGMVNNMLLSSSKTLVFWIKSAAQPTTRDGFGIGFIAPYPTSWAPNGSCFGFSYGLGMNQDFAFSGWWYDYSIQSTNYMWSNDNYWHMVAVTMDDEYGCKLYVDGIRQFYLYENLTGYIVSEFTLTPSIFPFCLQWSSSEGIPDYEVHVDDIRIYNRPLSSAQIDGLYHEGGWPNTNLNQGLIVYYPFNGNANDESGNGHDGTVIGANSSSDRFGVANKAFSFDNQVTNSDYIDCGDVDLSNISFSVSAWGYNTGECNTEYILGHGSLGINYNNLHIGYWINNCFSFIFFSDDLNGPYYDSDPGWHHWVCTYDSDTNVRKIYRDNLLVAEGTSSQDYQGNGKLVIGTYDWTNINYNSGWNGSIDDLRIYNRALSETEIQALYHEGGWTGNP